MSLSSQLLDIEWLKNAYETNWLEEQLKVISAEKELLWEQCYDENECCFKTDFEALFSEGKFSAAALVLIEQWDEEEETQPIKVAIDRNSPDLTLALLALRGLSTYSDDNNLAIAVAKNSRSIFNLLLLHPNVSTDVNWELDKEAREIAEFCGVHDWYDYFTPHIWLMEEQYSFLYPHLNIDWQYPADGYGGAPLMVCLYKKRNFNAMSRLVAAGAEINPKVTEDSHERLVHLAINDWSDDDFDSQQGLKWLANFISFLNDDGWDGLDVLSELIGRDEFYEPTPLVKKLFHINAIEELESALEDQSSELFDLNSMNDSLERVLFAQSKSQVNHQNKSSSIIDDLLRLNLVKLDDAVEDIQFAVTKDGIEFAISYFNQGFGNRVLLPNRVIHKLEIVSPAKLQNMTLFQCQAILLSCSTKVYVALNIMANDSGLPLFTTVKGQRVADITRQNLLSDILATGGFSDSKGLSERLFRELAEFDTLRSYLSEEGLLKTLFTYDDLKAIEEHRNSEYLPGSALEIEIVGSEESMTVLVHCEVYGQKETFSHAAEDFDSIDDWAEILFRQPISIACKQCGVIGFRYGFAYEEECMECI